MAEKKGDIVHYIDSLPYSLEHTARISRLYCKYMHKDVIKSELEIDEFDILDTIICYPDLSQSDVAKLIFKGKAHAGKILNEMEKKGYITRIVDTQNNIMVKRTEITELGMKLYKETNQKVEVVVLKLLEDFSEEEVQTFLNLLQKFRNAINNLASIHLK